MCEDVIKPSQSSYVDLCGNDSDNCNISDGSLNAFCSLGLPFGIDSGETPAFQKKSKRLARLKKNTKGAIVYEG